MEFFIVYSFLLVLFHFYIIYIDIYKAGGDSQKRRKRACNSQKAHYSMSRCPKMTAHSRLHAHSHHQHAGDGKETKK